MSIQKVTILGLILVLFQEANAQLTVSTLPTGTQLAQQIVGPGVVISNITYTGAPMARGSFTGTGTNLGITRGVILSNGDISIARGPNNSTQASFDNGYPGDIDMTTQIGTVSNNAAVLEFDFIPKSDTVRIRYVWGSEEYPEYIGLYNDGFAIFISGGTAPNIYPVAYNIARIPLTSTQVSINTVNQFVNTAYYVNNSPGPTIQYDGMTTVLTAKAAVTACATYHLKIAIADATDGIYDSGVFIEEGSLTSQSITAGPDVSFCSGASRQLGAPAAVPGYTYAWSPATGLNNTTIHNPTVTLSNSTGIPDTITYTLTGTFGSCISTDLVNVIVNPDPIATFSYPGSPYCKNATNPAPLFSGGGQAGVFSSTAGLVFQNVNTGLINLKASTAGTYTVTNSIVANAGCPTASATSNVIINAVQDSSFTYPSAFICQQGTNPLPVITGLTGGTFSASQGLQVNPLTGEIDLLACTLGVHSVSYTTPGPCATTATFNLTISLNADASFSYGGPYCDKIGGNPKPLFPIGSRAGTFTAPVGIVFKNKLTGEIDLSNSIPGVYLITNTIPAAGGCNADIKTYTVTINPIPQSPFQLDPNVCIGQISKINYLSVPNSLANYNWNFNGGAIVTGTGVGPYDISWNTIGPKTVSLTVTENGCISPITNHSILVNDLPNPAFTVTSPVCEGVNSKIGSANSIATSVYTWSFDGGLINTGSGSGPFEVTWMSAGSKKIDLNVTDINGCISTLSLPVLVEAVPIADFSANISLPGTAELDDNSDCELMFNQNSSNYTIVNWDFGDGTGSTSPVPSHTYHKTGTYLIKLALQNGSCFDSLTKSLTVLQRIDLIPTEVFTPNGDGVNDEYTVETYGIKNYTLNIYNRWGERIFEGTNLTPKWNGKYGGTGDPVSQGVYVYQLQGLGNDGRNLNITGSIALIR